jgi:hypothetical protein
VLYEIAADKGSVITKDYAVSILIELCSARQYAENTCSLLIEQLINRLNDIEKDTKRKRVEKVIKKFS